MRHGLKSTVVSSHSPGAGPELWNIESVGHLCWPAGLPSWRPSSWGEHFYGSPSDHHLAASGCLTQKARTFSSQCCSLKHYLTGISIRKKSTALMSQKGVEFACPHSWHLFTSEYLLGIYYVPGIVLGFENPTMSKAQKVFACILHSSRRQ